MISSPSDTPTLTLPVSLQAHQQAQHLCSQHRDRQKAQQIYLNVLAVSAVHFYLQCMGIDTDWDSQSFDPVLLAAMDTAALNIVGLGKLECRPVLPHQSFVYVPPEVWTDRLGYVAVQFDADLRSATLSGFIEVLNTPELPLSQLKPLDTLLIHLHQVRQAQGVESRICLSRWLENVIDEGWRSLDLLLGTHRNQLALSFRTNHYFTDATVKRAKLLDLGLQLDHQFLAILIAVTPMNRVTALTETQDMLDILVQLHPGNGMTHLPSEVQMSLHAESGEVLQNVRSRQHDNYIQLKRFRGIPGECFDIRISLGNTTMVEKFVI